MSNKQKTYAEVLAMIDREAAARAVAKSLVYLGGKLDWGVDEFMGVQEALFSAKPAGLPDVGDQDDDALKFWGLLSEELGFDHDYEPEEEDEDWD